MEPVKKHSIAIEGFDGQTEIVQADELRVCVPTKACIQFWATIVACFVCIGLGVFFMIYQGTTSAYYSVGLAMIGLGTGCLSRVTSSSLRISFLTLFQVQTTEVWHQRRMPRARPFQVVNTHRVPCFFLLVIVHVRSMNLTLWKHLTHLKMKKSCLETDTTKHDLIRFAVSKCLHDL